MAEDRDDIERRVRAMLADGWRAELAVRLLFCCSAALLAEKHFRLFDVAAGLFEGQRKTLYCSVAASTPAGTLTPTQTTLINAVAAIPTTIAVVLATAAGQRTVMCTLTNAAGTVVPNCPVQITIQTTLGLLTGLASTTLQGTTDAIVVTTQVALAAGALTVYGVTNASGVYSVRLNLTLLAFSGMLAATCGAARGTTAGS